MKKIYKEEDLPVYEIVIDDFDNSGIRFISIVGEPAIEMMGMAFNKEQRKIQLELSAMKDKQVIIGPAMIPGKKIARKDDNGNKYFVVFSKETIQQMVQKFNATGTNRRINIDHTKEIVDAYIFESWIVEDPYYDKSRMYGFDVPVGTYMIMVKVDDEEFWKDEVRANGKYGFSIEGLMSEKPLNMSVEDVIDNLTEDELIQMFNEIKYESDEEKILTFFKERGYSKQGVSFAKDKLDLPSTKRVYYYKVKEGMGPDVKPNTRDFCKHMLMIDKYWTEDDINDLSDQLGYSFWDYFGSYNCRHELGTAFVSEDNRPTAKEIRDGVTMQDDAGLAN